MEASRATTSEMSRRNLLWLDHDDRGCLGPLRSAPRSHKAPANTRGSQHDDDEEAHALPCFRQGQVDSRARTHRRLENGESGGSSASARSTCNYAREICTSHIKIVSQTHASTFEEALWPNEKERKRASHDFPFLYWLVGSVRGCVVMLLLRCTCTSRGVITSRPPSPHAALSKSSLVSH